MIAGANFLYLTVFQKGWAPVPNDVADVRDGRAGGAGFEAGLADKAMAITSIFAWLAVLYAGRMLPFIGHAF
jgi:hypothetical protein